MRKCSDCVSQAIVSTERDGVVVFGGSQTLGSDHSQIISNEPGVKADKDSLKKQKN